jgi:AcrR family transcriptional regulator
MSGRPLRADACRNRDRLLEVAAATFAEQGVDASLEEIAKRASVGIGTLYRHYPNRNVLIEAVYRNEVEHLCDSSVELLETLPPDEALAEWMRRFVAYVATKRGLAMALKSMISADSDLFAYTHARVRAAITSLVDAGKSSGRIRPDADPDDLLRALSGVCMATDQPGWQEQACRISGLLMDGLRYGAVPA